ncbi:MAG TPA: metal-dependent hydrolase [Bacteroidales bacterium]|jgi:L-ascorbate metabolism protein UlaG (beta-lactamase superfamily)|nr:metal-dependent hydrolase [Bacteroidales bacterium]HBZ21562.1 metal-dependent hydrolase [Bacteroidales bacterium]
MKNITYNLIFIAMTSPVFSQDLPEVDRISTSAGDVEMFFIGHGSLMFRVNDFVIHIDPVKSSGKYDTLPKADLILVTHEHGDHLDTELINQLRKQTTVMFCNSASASRAPWAQVMKAGDIKTAGNVTIEATPAYNIVNERAKGQPFHPKGAGNGYIIKIGDKKFYIAGDTENTPEMKALKGIDVAFLPMNLPYTMTPAMVADAAKSFKPKILYPYHFGDTNTDEIVSLMKGTETEVRIRKLK